MGLTVIQGTFHVVGTRPDGDTIRFRAEVDSHWSKIQGPIDFTNKNGERYASLRFEGIDTLETHVFAKGGEYRQPTEFGDTATDRLLELVGITDIVWGGDGSRRFPIQSATEGTPGHIFARASDGLNGRVVAFVFSGLTDLSDGEEHFLDAARLRGSLNYRLVEEGLAYPTFYETLFFDLRNELRAATEAARLAGRGLWELDATTAGFDVASIDDLEETAVILPKLFRRLLKYMAPDGTVVGFKEWLASRMEEVTRTSNGQHTHFDTFVEVAGSEVRLLVPPEDLVFKPERPVT